MSKASWRLHTAQLASGLPITLTGCGSLAGFPFHGDGQRFATEERLFSPHIQPSLKDIKVTPLQGMRVAVFIDQVDVEYSGHLDVGRRSPGLLSSVSTFSSTPTTSTGPKQSTSSTGCNSTTYGTDT